MKHPVMPFLAAAVWIIISEILRNEVLLRSYWERHYAGLGLEYPDAALSGLTWVLWSVCLTGLLWVILRRFKLFEGVGVAWFAGFPMMWVVTGNLGVLPFALLLYSVPLSLLETLVAALILTYWPVQGRAQTAGRPPV
ncbi:MAG: hypothetical protein ACK4GT_13155 [Pararhodobacter sp.]